MSLLTKKLTSIYFSDVENLNPDELRHDLQQIENFLQQAFFWKISIEAKKLKKDCASFAISTKRPYLPYKAKSETVALFRHSENSAGTEVSYSKNSKVSSRRAENINTLLMNFAAYFCNIVNIQDNKEEKYLYIDFEKTEKENYEINQEYYLLEENNKPIDNLSNITTLKEYQKINSSGLIQEMTDFYNVYKKELFLKMLGETFIEIFTKYPDVNIVINNKNADEPLITTNDEVIDKEFANVFDKFSNSSISSYVFQAIDNKIISYTNKNIANFFEKRNDINHTQMWEQRQQAYNSIREKKELLLSLQGIAEPSHKPIRRI